MPVTVGAKKALRRDKKREMVNKPIRSRLKKQLRRVREEAKPENISWVYSSIDRAAKKRVIHKNTANRLKSRIARKTG